MKNTYNPYSIPHTLKERIVDLFILINFKEILPEYRLRDFGDGRIDSYLKEKEDFKNLPQTIERFLRENQI